MNNKFNGKGKLTFAANDPHGRETFLGSFMDGRFHGHGTVLLTNGDRFQAKWENGQLQGQGKSNLINLFNHT